MAAIKTGTAPLSTPDNAIRDLFLGGVAPSAVPTVYCMAGIPGSGKSTFVNAAIARGDFPAQAFLLDPDRVMNALPAYTRDFQRLGPQTAFEHWEMPARELAYAMMDEAVALRADIIKDMGCARTENYDKLLNLKQAGYRLVMFYIDCPVDEAIRRTSSRPRHTPEQMIRDRADAIAALLPRYRALVDEFTTLRTPGF